MQRKGLSGISFAIHKYRRNHAARNQKNNQEVDGNNKKNNKNKSPNPGGIPVEFSKRIVLGILNKCWRNEVKPSEMKFAELVTLYKEGNVEKAANYGPIARSPQNICKHDSAKTLHRSGSKTMG